MLRRIATLTALLGAVAPAAAQAAPFTDRVVPAGAPAARAAQAGPSTTVPLAGGGAIRVEFTPLVGAQPALAQSYVAFLDSLPHGDELARLRMRIADPREMARLCGGSEGDGILACYGAGRQEMIVPSTGLDARTQDGGYTVRYVLTHEYGHHIAANRRNDEFDGGALDYGPKRWASYEMVCNQALQRRLFPGDEADRYRSNPGEGWAEVYARLTFPEQPWTFTPLLVPDAGALEAARLDVLRPWTRNRTVTFTMPAGRDVQSFQVPLTLDGRVRATITGPHGSEVGIRVRSSDQVIRSETRARKGPRDVWRIAAGCREEPTEMLTFTAVRRGGADGPVTLRVSYPG